MQARGGAAALKRQRCNQIRVEGGLSVDFIGRWVFKDDGFELGECSLKVVINNEVIEGVVLRNFISRTFKSLLNGIEVILATTD